MKKLIVIVLTVLSLNGSSQKMVGGGLGYSYGISYYKYHGDVDFNCLFGLKYFGIKVKIGFQPSTSFGIKTKALLVLGFTTKIERRISFHFLIGAGHLDSSRGFGKALDKNGTNLVYNGQTRVFANSGFYFNPFKNKNIYLGLDSYFYTEYFDESSPGPLYHGYSNSIITTDLSINYLFNRKKKEENKPQVTN